MQGNTCHRRMRAYLDFLNSGAASVRQEARRLGSYSRFSHAGMPECQNARRGLVHIWASPSSIIHHPSSVIRGSAWRLALSGQGGGVMGFSLRARGLRCGAKDRLGSWCSGPVSMLHGAAHQRPSRDGGARGGLLDWPGGGQVVFLGDGMGKAHENAIWTKMGKRTIGCGQAPW